MEVKWCALEKRQEELPPPLLPRKIKLRQCVTMGTITLCVSQSTFYETLYETKKLKLMNKVS